MKATFRGVPFFIATASLSGGRRGVTHEYPGRDIPFREDLGRKGRTFPVDGYVVGDDYAAQRDALLAAFETKGPGELVHPAHGTRRVAVDGFTFRESSTEGRLASFSVEFVETPSEASQPSAAPDVRAVALSSVAKVQAAIAANFLATYRPAVNTSTVSAAIGNAGATARAAASGLPLSVQERAELVRDVGRMGGALARNAGGLVSALQAVLNRMPGGLLALYRFDPGERPPSATSNRIREQENFDAVQRLIQQLALVRAVELALAEDFESYEAAVSRRDELATLLDEQGEVVNDEVYPALVQLQADMTRAIPPPGVGLARLSAYTPPVTLPSLVLAHRLYGDVGPEADVVARNRPLRPGFLAAGVPLEVLTRG